MKLILYYREGCHLCDDMEFSLTDMINPSEWEIHKINIDQDEDLRQRFNADVPVLCIDGKVICRHFLDREALKRAFGE